MPIEEGVVGEEEEGEGEEEEVVEVTRVQEEEEEVVEVVEDLARSHPSHDRIQSRQVIRNRRGEEVAPECRNRSREEVEGRDPSLRNVQAGAAAGIARRAQAVEAGARVCPASEEEEVAAPIARNFPTKSPIDRILRTNAPIARIAGLQGAETETSSGSDRDPGVAEHKSQSRVVDCAPEAVAIVQALSHRGRGMVEAEYSGNRVTIVQVATVSDPAVVGGHNGDQAAIIVRVLARCLRVQELAGEANAGAREVITALAIASRIVLGAEGAARVGLTNVRTSAPRVPNGHPSGRIFKTRVTISGISGSRRTTSTLTTSSRTA